MVIISEQQIEKKASVLNCPRCSLVNAIENKYCSKCSYPLVPSAFDEIKQAENIKFQDMEERFNTMESQMRSLIAAIGRMDQSSKNIVARHLFHEGIYKGEEINSSS
jgi:4-hydroxy-3-methylbut-2-en-1-yl diphosphate synthase IspG/GcpE